MSLRADSFIEPDWPAPAPVKAWVSTRQDGESQPPYDSFNLALHVNDDAGQVMRNRAVLASYLGLSPASFHWLEQVHGTEVMMIDSGHAQKVSPAHRPVQADASFTALARQVSVVMTADCLPVLFCNQQGTQVAAAHAGWRGLCSGVLENTLACFDDPAQVMAWLGPAIGPQQFEVGAEVRQAFVDKLSEAESAFVRKADKLPHAESSAKYLGNLYELARQRLRRAGIAELYGGGFCTYEDAERFYSFRRDGAASGRMASMIFIQE